MMRILYRSLLKGPYMLNKYFVYFFLLLSVFVFTACDMIPGFSEKTEFTPRKEKPVEPVQVDVSNIKEQGKELKRLFADKYVPLEYSFQKNPFRSVVEIYKKSQQEEGVSSNPLRNVTLEKISLVGTLQGDVGIIGVINAEGSTYYVKTGDKIGENRGVIIDISANKLRIRQREQDIFGNVRSVIKELTLEPKEEAI
ncbi:hypothetical protein Flexsi_0513 [Flexistipes sinusarabici DSM 4947]|uniref:Pilus assembly protein PilP n=2 Tax=Flexistipes sinusarabici TaxID=2352 RepID=F8E9E8_FLESM|nr:hypothetical protein Flexsi_0513 [Flexistipes sinusarabici DSM 4947]